MLLLLLPIGMEEAVAVIDAPPLLGSEDTGGVETDDEDEKDAGVD